MSADPVLTINETSPIVRKRRSLPRAMRIALSLSRGTIAFFLFGLFVMLGGSFTAGLVVGLRTKESPMIVERIVEKETPKPVPAQALNVAPQPAEDPVAAKQASALAEPIPDKPKLQINIGPPENDHAWSVQIGAHPDLPAAEASLDRYVAALAAHPIYIVPAEIKGKGIWHRVRIGAFKSKNEAEKARAALPDELAKQAMVVSYR